MILHTLTLIHSCPNSGTCITGQVRFVSQIPIFGFFGQKSFFLGISFSRFLDYGHVHINVLPVWEMGITGKDVFMAIIDDGVEVNHPDLARNWNIGNSNWYLSMAFFFFG